MALFDDLRKAVGGESTQANNPATQPGGLLQRLLGDYNVGVNPDTIKKSMLWVTLAGAALISFYFLIKKLFK